MLRGLCVAGGICGALMLAGLVPTIAAAAAWLLYLSLCTPIVPFMNFQWDALLLEAGLLAIFLPPPVLRLRWRHPARPSRLARFLLVWLLARVMFSSGVVKLTSGDAAWWDLTALTYHYWTQPLPPWTAWYLDRVPIAVHKLCCLAMFVVELGAPPLLFLPRRLRYLGGVSILGLMGIIAATGNYGFFNLLTACFCLLLFDDSAWRRFEPIFRLGAATGRPGPGVRIFRRTAALPLLLIFVLSWVPVGRVIGIEWRALYPLYLRAVPFRSVNGYGLFAVMTKTRDEITIQGSEDGVTWKDYGFRWKPGDPMRRPRFCIGHMPRLDWQMWFASLGDIRGNRWLVNTLQHILEGDPEVLALLGRNPFPDGPPRFVRAVTQPYRFTSFEERRDTGAWWKVDGKSRLYCPALRLPDSEVGGSGRDVS
jgi:hypothetical protein